MTDSADFETTTIHVLNGLPEAERGRALASLAERALESGLVQQLPPFVIRELVTNVVRPEFDRCLAGWKDRDRFTSDLGGLTSHPAYQGIVALGLAAVPLLLQELEAHGGLWFTALRRMTGADPVRDTDRGDVDAMRMAWLEWGRESGLL